MTRPINDGMLLSTGMEDYYDSAFYFNGGGFHDPVAGLTHKPGNGDFSFSGSVTNKFWHNIDYLL